MALAACRECGRQASSEAKICPQCGIEWPILPTWTAYDAIKAVIYGLIVLCVIFIVANYILLGRERVQKEEQPEQQCLNEHPLNPKQISARKHFDTCWQYRHTSSAVWSDNQRRLMLLGEGCYSDDRDDPRYQDADYGLCKSR